MLDLKKTPIQEILFQGFEFFVKRDDLLDIDFSGNKARKLYYYLENSFDSVDTLVSYGSNQSNAMYSLSVLAKLKKWKFEYYIDHLPLYLEENPIGNYKASLENEMKILLGKENYIRRKENKKTNELFIQEGGAQSEASYGLEILANEIKEFIDKEKLENIKVFLPSGTGTTALYLQKHLPKIDILTCACVGQKEYLQKQFEDLELNIDKYPTVLNTPRKFHFGKLYKENYDIYLQLLEETKIEFDLLYDPIGWQTILEYKKKHPDIQVIYIHQGGLLGNISMLQRYQRKYDK